MIAYLILVLTSISSHGELRRLQPLVIGCKRPRLCKNAGSVLKSALLLKICRRLVSQQTWNLRRNAFFVPTQTIKPARKRFYTASAIRSHPGALHPVVDSSGGQHSSYPPIQSVIPALRRFGSHVWTRPVTKASHGTTSAKAQD